MNLNKPEWRPRTNGEAIGEKTFAGKTLAALGKFSSAPHGSAGCSSPSLSLSTRYAGIGGSGSPTLMTPPRPELKDAEPNYANDFTDNFR